MSLSLAALAELRAFVFDLDGVIWRGESAVPGAAECVNTLRQRGRTCLFATNNSSRPPQFFADKLRGMGIEAAADDVVTSSTATAFHVARHFPANSRVFVVGEEGIAHALQGVGSQLVGLDADEADLVVAGIDRSFTYEKLKTAQRLILKGAAFIATNRDATFPVEGGVVPGAGSIVSSIETATGTVPLSMGKPEPQMLLGILEKLGLSGEQVAMVGDRLDTDIACGSRAGVKTIYVATGVTPMEVAREASGEQKPDWLLEDLQPLRDIVSGTQNTVTNAIAIEGATS